MKKILGYSVLTLALLFGISYAAFPQWVTNAVTSARLQAAAWTFSALQTFGAGIDVSATGITLPSDDIVPDDPYTFNVCSTGCAYSTIQSAINAASFFTAGTCNTGTGLCTAGDVGAACTTDADCDVSQHWTIHVGPGSYSENLTIGTSGKADSANVSIVGAGRDRVTLTAASSASPAIQVYGGAFELRGMTVVSSSILGDAIDWTSNQVNEGYIYDSAFYCESMVAPVGCVRLVAGAGSGTRLEVYRSFIQHNGAGIGATGRLNLVTQGNRIITSSGLSGGTKSIFGVYWDPSVSVTNETWRSYDDFIYISYTTTSGTPTLTGADFSGDSGTLAHHEMRNAYVYVEELGTGGNGVVLGVGIESDPGNNMQAGCYNCNVTVSRPNDTGTAYATSCNTTNTPSLYISGGKYRASNSDSSAVDIYQNSNCVMHVNGADYTSISGAINTQIAASQANLSAGACIPGMPRVDTGGATQEFCICAPDGTQWDCIDFDNLNGPGD